MFRPFASRVSGDPRQPGSPDASKMPMQPIQPAPPASEVPKPAPTAFSTPKPKTLGELKTAKSLQSVTEAIQAAQHDEAMPKKDRPKTPGFDGEDLASVSTSIGGKVPKG